VFWPNDSRGVDSNADLSQQSFERQEYEGECDGNDGHTRKKRAGKHIQAVDLPRRMGSTL
jgi:hypothetical protein